MKKRTLEQDLKQALNKIANTIRVLSMEAVQKADSGHPGLPMGCAEIGAYLYGYELRHNPKNSNWLNRDRFILSAGHGSMLLYSCLHLSGFNLSLKEISNFRQLHSRTPGHPESIETDGVETTTGPLGQGVGNAVGTALGLKILAQKFNTPDFRIINNKVFALVGDGCIMEGVSAEVSSLAGHLQLDNLIVIYDANRITLDGPLNESCSENTKMRYQAYGWEVYEVDGYDLDSLHTIITHVRETQQRPCLIIAHTVIGKGAPTKSGSFKAHGSPLGPEEVKAAKAAISWAEEQFYIPQIVVDYFKKRLTQNATLEQDWTKSFNAWAKARPDLYHEFQKMEKNKLPEDLEERLRATNIGGPIATRKASQEVINRLGEVLPQLYGGSADLSTSDLTLMKKFPLLAPGAFEGRNIKFGVREFGMATIATGMAQTGMIVPFIGTFLTFSDYMRNAIRLCALMNCQVIYQFTHDSIFLGEDGPTHQPVEHLASLRAIPKLHVIRPADANEVKMAWVAALRYVGPTALVLSRQNLPILEATNVQYELGLGKGAYIVKKEEQPKPEYTLIATGSEVSLALDVAKELEKIGKSVRVVSMPCWEIFENQNQEYRASVLGGDIGIRVSIEAGIAQGWHKYIGFDGIAISVEGFGASAPHRALAEEYGFTVQSILERIL